MKVVFNRTGKYKNGVNTIQITNEDVNSNKVFDIVDKNAISYVNAKKASNPGSKSPNVSGHKEKK